jgi:hypothetical protein
MSAVQTDFEVVEVFPGTLNAGEIYVCRSRPKLAAEEDFHALSGAGGSGLGTNKGPLSRGD